VAGAEGARSWPLLGIARARRIIPSHALAVIMVRLVARRGAERGDDASLGSRVHRYKLLLKNYEIL